MLGRCLAQFALLAGIAACGSPPAPPSVPAVAASPAGPVDPDGNYGGFARLTASSGYGTDLCGSTDPIRLAVRDGQFSHVMRQPQVRWRPTITFNAVVAADGTFYARSGTASMRGRFTPGRVDGEIVGDACTYVFGANRA